MLQDVPFTTLVLIVGGWILIIGGVVLVATTLRRRVAPSKYDSRYYGSRNYDRRDEKSFASEGVQSEGRRTVLGLGAMLLGGSALWGANVLSGEPILLQESRLHIGLNLKDFGAVGDGKADDGPALREAMKALLARGGGTLYIPAGIYQCTVAQTPTNKDHTACAGIPANSQIIGEGPDSTVIRLAPNSPNRSYILCNYHLDQTDTNIGVEGLTIDGNIAKQARNLDAIFGLTFYGVQGIQVRNVVIKDIYGRTSGTPGPSGTPAEGFHADCTGCTDVLYLQCRVQSNRKFFTASGFSLNASSRVTYRDCVASGVGIGQGFTHWKSRDILYEACRAYNCESDGFHSEISTDVTYIACISGKTWMPLYGPNSGQQYSAPNRDGFTIFEANNVLILQCIGRANLNYGVYSLGTNNLAISGGSFTGNHYGIRLHDQQTASTATISGYLDLSGNSAGEIWSNGTLTQFRGALPAPGFPASGAEFKNPYPFDVTVYVHGGNVAGIQLDGQDVGAATGGVRLVVGSTIAVDYSVTPGWTWVGG